MSRSEERNRPSNRYRSPVLSQKSASAAAKWAALGSYWKRAKDRRAINPVMKIVCYAHDFVVLVAGTRGDARACCGMRNEKAIPPVRLRGFFEAFEELGKRNLYSICAEDYAPALRSIAGTIRARARG